MRFLYSFLFSFLFIPFLLAKGITNKELLAVCKDKTKEAQNFCYGYVISAANAAQFYRNIADIEDTYIDICLPEDISNKEIVDLYVDWAEKNPSVTESPAFLGVSSSFSSKYSCKPDKDSETEPKKSLLM